MFCVVPESRTKTQGWKSQLDWSVSIYGSMSRLLELLHMGFSGSSGLEVLVLKRRMFLQSDGSIKLKVETTTWPLWTLYISKSTGNGAADYFGSVKVAALGHSCCSIGLIALWLLGNFDPPTLPLQPQFRALEHLFGDTLLPKPCLLAPCLVAVETGSTADKGGSWVLLPPGPVNEDF